jgi:hypothetical protein
MAVRQESKKELTRALQERCWRSDRVGEGRILNTFCEATKYRRKYAIELLKHGSVRSGPRRTRRRGRPRTYDARVNGAASGGRRGRELDLWETPCHVTCRSGSAIESDRVGGSHFDFCCVPSPLPVGGQPNLAHTLTAERASI